MRHKRVNKNNNFTIIIQVLLFTTVIVTCITLSKYRTALGSKATVIIGNPKTTLIDEIELTDLKPGNSITSNFKVRNFEKENKSDINMIYTIKLETGNYLPLKFELKKLRWRFASCAVCVLISSQSSFWLLSCPHKNCPHSFNPMDLRAFSSLS